MIGRLRKHGTRLWQSQSQSAAAATLFSLMLP